MLRPLRILMSGTLLAGLIVAQKPPEPFSAATVINRHLPSWLSFGGEQRARFEGVWGSNFRPDSSDAYWLNRTRINLTIRPASWVKLFGETQDARVIAKQPGQPPFENVWDVHQAYAELGNYDKGHFALRAGRQEMQFYDGRIIGNVAWTNANRTFDAVRAVVRFGGYRVDAISASVVVNVNDTWDHHQQGTNLHGLYGEAAKLIPHATIQPYVFWRLQRRIRNEAGVVANLDEKVVGARVAGELPKGGYYNVEMVRELGSLGTDGIHAWMGHWELGRTWKKVRYTPRFWGEYNYFTGDSNARDGIRETYDPIYPTLHDKYGFADQIAGRNLKNLRGGLEAKLPHSLVATLELNDWWLATPFDALYSSAGPIAQSPNGTAGTHVGGEVDVITTWRLKGPVQAGAGLAYIMPGEFLKKTTPGRHFVYPYIVFTYKF